MKQVTKSKFVWTDEGFYKNVSPQIKNSYNGYIEERNEADKKFYENRMKLLEKFFADLLAPLIRNVFRKTRGEIKILDVGCGDGVILTAVNFIKKQERIKAELYGLDLDKKAMEKIKVHAKLTVGSATDMPFTDNTFQIIFSSQTLEHLTKQQLEKTLAEIFRVLVPGGVFYAETPNPNSLLAKVMDKEWWMLLPEHILLIPPTTLKKMLLDVGFKKIKVYSRAEIDEQINEIREIILRLRHPLYQLLPVRLRYFLLRNYVKFVNKGAVTICLAKKE